MNKQLKRTVLLFDGIVALVCVPVLVWVRLIVAPSAWLFWSNGFIPGEAITGGLFSFVYLFGYGMIGRKGIALGIAALEALTAFLMQSQTVLIPLAAILCGVSVEISMRMIGHNACCIHCTLTVGMVCAVCNSNVALSGIISILIAILSGGLGGLAAHTAIQGVRRWGRETYEMDVRNRGNNPSR